MSDNFVAEAFSKICDGKAADRKKRCIETLGILRGGNTGIYEEGEKPSHCVRKAALRSWHALEEEVGESKNLIFDNGLNSEAKLVEEWQYVLEPGQRILTQQECATLWKTDSGVPVSGSPDLLVVDKLGNKLYGLELKNMNSVYKAGKVLKEVPGADAVAQAAHYAHVHGIPWYLIYSSHTQFHNLEAMKWYTGGIVDAPKYRHILDWATRKVYEGKGVNKVEVGTEVYAKSLLGFRIAFQLEWRGLGDEAQVFIRFAGLLPSGGLAINETAGAWIGTVITWKRLKDYFEMLASCRDPKVWPPRPADLNIDGTESSFKPCDAAYCQLAHICKALDKDKQACMGKFADMVRQHLEGE